MTQPEHSITTEQATAYHEAGHAVIGERLGIALEYVTIIPDDDKFGHTRWLTTLAIPDKPLRQMTARPRALCEDGIVVMLAGAYSEEKYLGGSTPETVSGFGGNPEVEGPHRSSPGSDRDIVSEFGMHLITEDEERKWFLGWLDRRTRNMLNDLLVWLQVETVAEDLIVRRTLDRNEVRAVMRSVMSGERTK